MAAISENYTFRPSTTNDKESIWKILQQAIARRKSEGSDQWQQGYPNPETVEGDIQKNWGFVLEIDGVVAGYAAVIFEVEPAYEIIEGNWLTKGKYVVIHRVAIADKFAGQGLATKIFLEIEKVALDQNIFSIKVDTNFDNIPMLKILDKLNYTYCGEVYFRGSARKAFEKILR